MISISSYFTLDRFHENELQELETINKKLEAKFYDALENSEEILKFDASINLGLSYLHSKGPQADQFVNKSIVYASHLRRWHMVEKMMKTPSIRSLTKTNITFLFWQILYSNKSCLLGAFLSKFETHLDKRHVEFGRSVLAKRLEKKL